MPPSEWPARAKRRGAAASTLAAISPTASSTSIRIGRQASRLPSSAITDSKSRSSPSMPGKSTSVGRSSSSVGRAGGADVARLRRSAAPSDITAPPCPPTGRCRRRAGRACCSIATRAAPTSSSVTIRPSAARETNASVASSHRDAESLGLEAEVAVHARAGDRAGREGVDGDAERARPRRPAWSSARSRPSSRRSRGCGGGAAACRSPRRR